MSRILQPFRLIGVAISVATFLLFMSLVWLIVRDRWTCTRIANRSLSKWSRFTLFVLGVKVKPITPEHARSLQGALLVGNHTTYVDVLVIASQVSTCFVTSMEIKNSFGLGHICRTAGCLFVDRKNKRNIFNEVGEIQEGLAQDLKVTIFPEATSTDGEQIIKFRKPLYLAAIKAAKPVVPVVINYRRVGGLPIDVQSRDSIFWYGDMDFVPHLLRLTSNGGVDAEVHFLEPIKTSPTSDAGEIAETSQRLVESVFIPVKA